MAFRICIWASLASSMVVVFIRGGSFGGKLSTTPRRFVGVNPVQNLVGVGERETPMSQGIVFIRQRVRAVLVAPSAALAVLRELV